MNGVALLPLQPVRREVAIVFDRPWEGNASAYYSVFQDGDYYRMYYRGQNYDAKTKQSSPAVICYAESKDGIHWLKPELGLFEFKGSKSNNVIWTGRGADAFAVFKDANPACKPEQRYKALAVPGMSQGLLALQSADGIHWSLMQAEPVITVGTMEFHRNYRDGRRDVMTSTSADFLHWSKPVWLECPGGVKDVELYTNGVLPYYRAPHILFGFPVQYVATRESEFKPDDATGMNGITNPLFMTSRDGVHFRRWDEALIRPGLQTDCWGTRNNYPAWGLVVTKADTLEALPELSIYASEGYYQGNNCRLRRFTTRIDGFASVHATSRGGEMVTKPLMFTGGSLHINFATSVAGSIGVEIQDEAGKPISGYSLKDCPDVYGDQIDRVVAWKNGHDLSKLSGRAIRMRFVMKDADLYAFQFR
jgi:hypothetical protein